jgi:hypothetical protein
MEFVKEQAPKLSRGELLRFYRWVAMFVSTCGKDKP